MVKPVYVVVGFIALQLSLLICCAIGFGADSWPAFVATGAIDIIDLGIDWYLWRHFGYNEILSIAESAYSNRPTRVPMVIAAAIESIVIISAPLIGMLLARFIAHS